MAKADSEFIRGTPVTLPAGERERIEAAIQEHLDAAESLIGTLDAADPDVDDEPGLGASLASMHDQRRWCEGDTNDREEQAEDEGADEGAEYFTSLARYIPPTKGDVRAAKAVRGFIRLVKRNGKLGAKIPVTAICVPTREGSR